MALRKDLAPGEAAARAGMSVSALHFYEREGLIRSWRTEGNQRRYDRATLRRLGVIKAAQAVGLPLKEIKERLGHLPHDRPLKQADWEEVAGAWRKDLEARITRLQRLSAYLDGCIGCGCLSMDRCPLYNPDDTLGQDGPGPRTIGENF